MSCDRKRMCSILTQIEVKDEEIARLKEREEQLEEKIYAMSQCEVGYKKKLAAVRTWFHKLCPRGAESSEMMKLERIIGDVGVEKDREFAESIKESRKKEGEKQ